MLDGRRVVPSPELAPYVHHYWAICWSLRSPFVGESLPHPATQILRIASSSEQSAIVVGPRSGALARPLVGEGRTFGVSFRPAMFHALFGESLTDRIVPLGEVLGPSAATWTRAIDAAREPEEKVALAETWLASRLPAPPEHLTRVRDLAEHVAADRSIVRVEDLVRTSGLGLRALQRAFRTYVGLSPKSVIRRSRLHEALVQLRADRPPALAALAASLGYADQAHFGRDFKRTIGQSPQAYLRDARPSRPR